MSTVRLIFPEWCPSCGNGVDKLNPVTGFCLFCTPVDVEPGYALCESCGDAFILGNRNRKTCDKCVNTNIVWLRRNADAIERVMVFYGIDSVSAIQRVYDDNRPRCAMCGDKIKHGTRSRVIFCGKRDGCRRASIRYRNYKTRSKMSDDDALERAIHGTRK